MQLHQLQPKVKRKRKKRVGRGGPHGKTSGRGHKGQKARAGHRIRPEMRDTIKKLPKLRGRGTHALKGFRTRPVPVNLDVLERAFGTGERVTPRALVGHKLVQARRGRLPAVKILGKGALTKKLTVSGCAISQAARKHIEAAGGSIME